ncbi:transcription factor DIVARICATA-like [Malania oleifera]|uniref:transcription factor DIVARICATA-like n=1 Tax=Malania oleifera TaxID=397392 RepID=UPI0025AEA628|nr:transcription factor DIVARICATA-like [Malania oleifera]
MSGGNPSAPAQSSWTWVENKVFEQGLVQFPDETPDRWNKIAGLLPDKSPAEVQQHFEALLHDVNLIESGQIEVPCYADLPPVMSDPAAKSKKKASPWSKEEHRLFLHGLDIYGKGDWRSISRYAVVSRTPTQVASHAQKYFIRKNAKKNERMRSSIHDVTIDCSLRAQPPSPAQAFQCSPP